MLALLEKNRGRYISGEEAAAGLHISRNAVWKAVGVLREEGYRIEAAPRKGYRLAEDSDILSAESLLQEIGLPLQKEQIHVFRELASTNRTAKELALDGAGHGTVVIADRQSRGSGRFSRTFYSPEGGIYMSILLRPDHVPYREPSMITVSAAAVTADAIEMLCGVSPQIKWINDLYLDGKKICGILTESASDFESGELEWIVLGIGINFAVKTRDFPEELRKKAGSIYGDRAPAITRARLAGRIIRGILTVGNRSRKDIIDSYRARLMMKNETVLLRSGGGTETVKMIDIDENGRLIAEDQNGRRKTYFFGEISVRRM